MHQAAISNGRKNDRKRKLVAEHGRTHAAIGQGHGMARPKRNIVEYSAILAKRYFAFGTAVQIIEN
jgi:hypothetical protein